MKRTAPSLLLLLVLTACRSKSSACAKVTPSFDPIAKELDALAAEADTAPPPSPADQASCAQLTDRLRRLEGAEAKLALVVTDDAPLAKHLESYRSHVRAWAAEVKKAQLGCLGKDGNAMTAGIRGAIEARGDLKPEAAELAAYCRGDGS